jgi:hypothetical protein
MPDGDSLLLGTTNTSAAETSLERSGDDIHTALAVNNTNGNGIVGRGAGGLGGPAFVAPVVGVVGQSEAGFGVAGDGSVGGVLGTSESGTGVSGDSRSGDGVVGSSESSNGVSGFSTSNHGVEGSGPFSGIHGYMA